MKVHPRRARGAPAYRAAGFFDVGVFQFGIDHTASETTVFCRRVGIVHRQFFQQRSIDLKNLRRARGDIQRGRRGIEVFFRRAETAVAVARVHNVVVRQPVEHQRVVVIRLAVETHRLGRDFAGARRLAGGTGKLRRAVVEQEIADGAVAQRPAPDVVGLNDIGTQPHAAAFYADFLQRRRLVFFALGIVRRPQLLPGQHQHRRHDFQFHRYLPEFTKCRDYSGFCFD